MAENRAYRAGVDSVAADIRAALADVQREDYGNEWEQTHKGHLRFIEGHVWDCYDDYCGCTEAQVTAVFHNRVTGNSVIRIGLWSGNFYTDHESGADEELIALRRQIAATDPDLDGQITWQGGIDYAT